MEEATFIPVSPMTLSADLDNWINYLNIKDYAALVQTAIAHAQFELIHPFKDGNGRIGRIIIPLLLHKKDKLSSPHFYLSEYLEKHRDTYYAKLLDISENGNWGSWIEFFLKAIIEQAKANSKRVKNTMLLYDKMKLSFSEATSSQYSTHLLDAIFKKPIFKSSDLSKSLAEKHHVNKGTLLNLIKKLKDADILKESMPSSGSRGAILYFKELLLTAEGKEYLLKE